MKNDLVKDETLFPSEVTTRTFGGAGGTIRQTWDVFWTPTNGRHLFEKTKVKGPMSYTTGPVRVALSPFFVFSSAVLGYTKIRFLIVTIHSHLF